MEARLAAHAAEAAATPVRRIPEAIAPVVPALATPAAAVPAVDPAVDLAEAEPAAPAAGGGEPASWPDEAAESAFRAEARDRGEVPVAVAAPGPAEVEETDPKALPALDTLVRRIPGPVVDALDDLFRARFVRVQKFPRRSLKSGP